MILNILSRLLFGFTLVFFITACNSISSGTTETITLTGFYELEIENANTAVTISFNGKKSDKALLVTLIKSGVLAQFEPKLQYENMYSDGDGSSREFTYSLSYLLVLKDNASLDVVVRALEENNLSAYITRSGSFIEPTMRAELLDKLFDSALENGVFRIKKYAEEKGKDYRVIAVSDADYSYEPVIPVDGIAYQQKVMKRVAVTAELF